MDDEKTALVGEGRKKKTVPGFVGSRSFMAVVAFLLCGILALSIGGISALGFFNIAALEKTERYWTEFTDVTKPKIQAIEDIHDSLGYGGLIHNFKNFVLRQDITLTSRIERDFARVYEAIERFRASSPSPVERQALTDLEATVKEYEAKFSIAKRVVKAGRSAQQIDSSVRVDDTKALLALDILRQSVFGSRDRTVRITTDTVRKARQSINWSFLIIPILVVVASGIIWFFILLWKSNRERDEFHRQLEKSEERLASALDGAGEGYWDWDIPGESLFVSDRLQQIIGYSSGAIWIPVQSWRKNIHPDDRAEFDRMLSALIKKEIDRCVFEFRLRNRRGEWVWTLMRGRVVEWDQDGRAVRACGGLTDISQRKKAEFEAQENRRTLIDAIEVLPDAFVLYDADDRLVICNENYRSFYPKSAAIIKPGRTFEEIIRYGVEKGEYAVAGKTKEEQEAWVAERLQKHSNPSGDTLEQQLSDGRWLRISEEKTSNGGTVGFRVDVSELVNQKEKLEEDERRLSLYISEVEEARDLLERQAAEMTGLAERYAAEKDRAEAADRSKSEFLATMSHEIRTPMAGVLGMAEALLESDLNSLQKTQAEMIRESGLALMAILNDILDLSKLEAGRFEVEAIDFDLRDSIHKVVDLLGGKASEKHLKLKAEIPNNLPIEVKGDPSRLRQILLNLVGNAIKFTHDGEIVVGVSLEKVDGAATFYRFEVTDTGIGINEEVKHSLFADFTQADSSISRKFGGTGLGLSISKRLTKLMGGEIGVESVEGKGSTFWFTLPLRPAEGEIVREFQSQKTIQFETRRTLDILIADDNHIIQAILGDMLNKQGHRLIYADTGVEALEAVEGQSFDCIIMDMRMPEMDGATATREIRKMSSGIARIPILACTADAMTDHQEKFFDAGVDACLVKPINRAGLLEKINEVMREEIHAPIESGAEEPEPDIEEEMVAEDDEDIANFLASLDSISK